jgi:acyl carrier protein
MITRDELVEFFETELGVELEDLGDDDPLFSSGVIDSFALVTLMMHLERTGGVRIDPTDVTLDNLDTLNRILAFSRRLSA